MVHHPQQPDMSTVIKSALRTLFHTDLKYIVLLVGFLVMAVIWVFGTLPWVIVNSVLCTPDPGVACAAPQNFGRYIRFILSADIIVLLLSGFAIFQLRRLHRLRQ